MSQKIIRSALEGRAATWASAQSPALSVAWENVVFEPTEGTSYIRSTLLPGQTQNPIYGPGHRRMIGIMQFDVVFPLGGGVGAAETIAESLVAYFPRGLSILQSGVKTHIDKSPSIGPLQRDGAWRFFPISVPYRMDSFTT